MQSLKQINDQRTVLTILLGTVGCLVLMTMTMAVANGQGPAEYHGRGLTAFTEPYHVLELAASDIGRITLVNVKRGSRVRQGDLLCELPWKWAWDVPVWL